MKTINSGKPGWRSVYALFPFTLILMIALSCDTDPAVSPETEEDSEATLSDSEEAFFTDDADDMAMELVEDTEALSNGKTAGEGDGRLMCATVTRTGDEESGTITMDFGDGCVGPRGNTRRGSIVIHYFGRLRLSGSYYTLTYTGYSINGIQLRGTRTVKNISESEDGVREYSVGMEDGEMEWADGSIARRRIHHTRRVERDPSNLLDRLIIYGTAEGNHRNGRGFYIEILEPLVYDRACHAEGVVIPVEGVKLIKHGERQITVDYGNGTCDNVVQITNKNGHSWRYEVGS